MLKVFRHIRKSLLKQNRFSRYLLYAIGEIILVVIGILIALQVNTWKEEKNDRLLEQKILEGLFVEFENAQYELEMDSIARNSIYNSINYFIDIKNGKIPFPKTFDTIASSIEAVKRYRFYTPSHPQLKDLQSSGRFDLIDSKDTREGLLDYIEWWERVSTLEKNTQNSVIANLRPYLAENCDLSLIDSKNPEQQLQFVSQIKTMTQKTNFGSMLRLRLEDLYPIIFYSENLMLSIKNCQETIKKDLNAYNK